MKINKQGTIDFFKESQHGNNSKATFLMNTKYFCSYLKGNFAGAGRKNFRVNNLVLELSRRLLQR